MLAAAGSLEGRAWRQRDWGWALWKNTRSMRPSNPRGSPQAFEADPLERQTDRQAELGTGHLMKGKTTLTTGLRAGEPEETCCWPLETPGGLPHSLPHPCRHMQVHVRNQGGVSRYNTVLPPAKKTDWHSEEKRLNVQRLRGGGGGANGCHLPKYGWSDFSLAIFTIFD